MMIILLFSVSGSGSRFMPKGGRPASEGHGALRALTDHRIGSEIAPSGRKRGKEWECRALAVNKAGEDEPGNTVMAVL